jgi:hypothetical protein
MLALALLALALTVIAVAVARDDEPTVCIGTAVSYSAETGLSESENNDPDACR